jgi:TM2 domain-containing membrane protein YozV
MSNWYLLRNGQAYGPYPEEQVRGWVRAGQVAADELLNREGEPNWQPLGAIPEFAGDLAVAPAPAPFTSPAGVPSYYGVNPPRDKIVAGVLALLLGPLGVHHFYLGNTGRGVLYLLVSLLSAGTLALIVWAFSIIDGIMYLSKPDDQFQRNYHHWFCSGE